jgi:hypothetical protein
MLDSLRLPMISVETWREMSDDRRFALLKLTRNGHARNLEAALREFKILNGHTGGRCERTVSGNSGARAGSADCGPGRAIAEHTGSPCLPSSQATI